MSDPEPANPIIWMLVQIVEFMLVIAILPHVLPDATPRWLRIGVFVLVVAAAFFINLRMVMPWIDRARSRSPDSDDADGRDA